MLNYNFNMISGEHANEQIGTRTKVSGDEISQVIATFGPVSVIDIEFASELA